MRVGLQRRQEFQGLRVLYHPVSGVFKATLNLFEQCYNILNVKITEAFKKFS
jgi:hypothetical protein